MSNVVTMPGVTAPDTTADCQPVHDLIKELELLLGEARSGELRAIAVATVRIGGCTGTLWQRPPDGYGGHFLMAAISYLQHRYSKSMCDDSAPRETEGSA